MPHLGIGLQLGKVSGVQKPRQSPAEYRPNRVMRMPHKVASHASLYACCRTVLVNEIPQLRRKLRKVARHVPVIAGVKKKPASALKRAFFNASSAEDAMIGYSAIIFFQGRDGKTEHMTQRLDRFRDTYLRPSILGAIDGLITSFVIVAGGFASNASTRVIALIGFSSLFADGISMGVSEVLSSRAEKGDLRLRDAALQGAFCFIGFVSFGAMPLIGYVVGRTDVARLLLSTLLFFCFLLIVGVIRAWVASQSVVRTVAETVSLGSVACGIAYGIASL